MDNYKVTITETFEMEVEVQAENRVEAEQIVTDNWNDGKYILDADYFIGADFNAVIAD